MIAFECDNCGKPQLVPDSKAGTSWACPGCRFVQAVPVIVRSPLRKLPWVKLTFLALAILVGLAYWGMRAWNASQSELLQREFALQLQSHSQDWSGIEWKQCDLLRGNYRVVASHIGGGRPHTFEAMSIDSGAQSAVQIDPRPDGQLGYAFVSNGQLRAFDYYGQEPDEKQELTDLALDLDHALSSAIRAIQRK